MIVDYLNASYPSPLIAIYFAEVETAFGHTFDWICPPISSLNAPCSTREILRHSHVNGFECIPGGLRYSLVCGKQLHAPVKYRLSQPVSHRCHIKVVPLFLIIVVICNCIKIFCFVATLLTTQREPILLTTGDAVQSFLKEPDPAMQCRCLATKADFEGIFARPQGWEDQSRNGKVFQATTGRRWGRAVRLAEWVMLVHSPPAPRRCENTWT